MAAVLWPKLGGQAPGQVGGKRLTPPAGDLPKVSVEPQLPQSISSAMLWSMYLQLACARQASGHRDRALAPEQKAMKRHTVRFSWLFS